LEDVAVLFPKCVPKREEMCVVVLSRVSTDDDEKNVSAVYSVSRRPFVVDLLANEDTETTAFRSLEEERETTECFCADKKDGGPVGGGGIPREKKVDKTGSKKKTLKKTLNHTLSRLLIREREKRKP